MYKQMVKAGVAEQLDEPQYQDLHGNIVEKDKSFGLPVKYSMCFPEYVLFVYKARNNACVGADEQLGGHRKGGAMKIVSCTKDALWTLLGFTNTKGKPVSCATIITHVWVQMNNWVGIEKEGL